MKKLLLTTAACGLVFAAAPASADGVELDLGGFYKGYGVFIDQDTAPDDQATVANENVDVNDFDFIRYTEIQFGGETTLDNGLTVGAQFEADTDGSDGFELQESYVYFSGGWGRVNFGAEDGAAYLLQVAAPSADGNIDGLRQHIQPVNYAALTQQAGATNNQTSALLELFNPGAVRVDYDQAITGADDKLTYLSPILNGFQLGLSYTPDLGDADDTGTGVRLTDVLNAYGRAYDAAFRYEGQFNNVGVNFGAGFSHRELEKSNLFTGLTGSIAAGQVQAVAGDVTDDNQVWNVGLDLDFGPFGIGAIYKEDDAGDIVNVASTALVPSVLSDDEETFVVGVDYTTGPFKIGASYFDQDNTFGIKNLDTTRYSGGVVYTYGPGMTFRGSIGYVDLDGEGIGGRTDSTPSSGLATDGNRDDADATYITLGTQINF